jgi:hypothetical protein
VEDDLVTEDDGDWGRSRREFLRALGGAVGVTLAADATTLAGAASAAVRGPSLPSGYAFHRVLTVRGKGNRPGFDDVVEILPGVMINDRSEVIFHARTSSGGRTVHRMRISHDRRPDVQRPRLIVATGQTLPNGMVAERIAAGDTNRNGTYVTVVRGSKDFNAVFMQRPGRELRTLLEAGDRTPGGGNGRYSGSFGDVDIDTYDSVLLSARYTQPGKVGHGLFLLPGGDRRGGRVLLRSGQRIPDSRAAITGFGLIERRGPYFVAQVFGRQPKHRRKRNSRLEPSGFLLGRVDRGRREHRLLAGAGELAIRRSVIQGDAIVGPRVHRDGTAATVIHRTGTEIQLHRRRQSARPERLVQAGDRGGHGARIETISAPVFGADGLLFYRTISKRSMELMVADSTRARRILSAGEKIDGKRVQAFSVGWHTDQVDRHGRIAFQAELAGGETAIVIGTPL